MQDVNNTGSYSGAREHMRTTVLSAQFFYKAYYLEREKLENVSSKCNGRTLFRSQFKQKNYKKLFLRPLGKTGVIMIGHNF